MFGNVKKTIKKVLLVDDDKALRQMLADSFKLFGQQYEVVQAENGLQALELLAENSFDLLLTDLNMPLMNGYQLITKVKKVMGLSMPIIMMSGIESSVDRSLVEKLLTNNMIVVFLEKPFDLWALKNILKKI